jgi:hypothetical protein
MRRRITLSVRRDEWHMNVTDWPWYATLTDRAWQMFCAATRHRICCSPPEIVWKIPTEYPLRYDYTDTAPEEPDPWLENNLGSRLNDLSSWIGGWVDDQCTVVVNIRIDEDTARKLDPEFADQMMDAALTDAARWTPELIKED